VTPRTLLFRSTGLALLCAAWLFLLGYAGMLVGTPLHTAAETLISASIVTAVGVLFVSVPVTAGAVIRLLCGAWFRGHPGLDQEYRHRRENMLWSVGFALLSTAWLFLMGSAGVADRRPPYTPIQTVLVVSNGIAAYGLAISIVMAVGTALGAILKPFVARSTQARPPASEFPQTRARKMIFWSVGFALLSMAWVLLLGYAGMLDRRSPAGLVQTSLVVSFAVAGSILIVSIIGAVGGILGLLFGRQLQEYHRRDQEYRRSTESPPPLLFMGYAVWLLMVYLVVLATPVMNYVQGACSSAWECSNSISNGWFLTCIVLASVLDWIGKRVWARRRSLPSALS
jgi:MFS family permease